MTQTTVKLDIMSDPICPWCYIGKTHLDKALAAVPDHPFVIEWHPFQLNPDMPAEGMDRRAYLEGKFGGKEGAIKAYAPVVEHAEQAGLTINFDAMTRTPNTMDAHRLIHWAGIEGKQTQAVDALFKAYFVDASVVLKLLQSDADREDIAARDGHSRKMGVTSVPTFIVASQHGVPGAQPPELWGKVIHEIKSQLETEAAR